MLRGLQVAVPIKNQTRRWCNPPKLDQQLPVASGQCSVGFEAGNTASICRRAPTPDKTMAWISCSAIFVISRTARREVFEYDCAPIDLREDRKELVAQHSALQHEFPRMAIPCKTLQKARQFGLGGVFSPERESLHIPVG
jgi:hypothetical protein